MPTFGPVTNLRHGKLPGQTQRRFIVPVVLNPVLPKNTRQKHSAGVCLATQGGSRKLSQAARDYAAGIHAPHEQSRRFSRLRLFNYVRAQACEKELMKMIS